MLGCRVAARTVAIAGMLVGLVQPGVAAATLAPLTEHGVVDDMQPKVVPGRVVISWEPDTPTSVRAGVLSSLDLDVEERLGGLDADVVDVPSHAAEQIAAALEARPGVAVVEPDYVMSSTSNDPGYGQLWGLHAIGGIDAPGAWTTTKGRSDVIVAVIDTGIDITHPDLAGNIWRNPGEIAGNGIDDDRNGFVDDVHGWDFRNGDASVFDASEDSHGTHVAGTIAAVGDNGLGVVGVAPNVKIMPLKFLGSDGSGSSSHAAAAVAYARRMGATVINASWGGGGGSVLQQAIKDTPGAVLVAGAGNLGLDLDANQPQYPAAWADDAFGMPNVVSVASVTSSGAMSSFSNFGARTVDLGAPGSSILSTTPNGTYGNMSGTSMAAPHASGVAALAASVDRRLTGAQLVTVLKSGVRPLAALAGKTVTGGYLNAPGTVRAAGSLVQAAPTPTAPAPSRAPAPSTSTAPVPPSPVSPAPTGPQPYDGTGARTLDWACPGVLASGFVDVVLGTSHAPGVGCARTWGVFSGTADGRFGPKTDLRRGQLASVLVRGIEAATGRPLPTGSDHFVDDESSVHETAIDKLAGLGIVGGLSETRYGPSASVTRGQFASMLARTYQYLAGALPNGPDAFVDDAGTVHERSINGLAALGIVAGTGDRLYGPGSSLLRDQSATLVSRLLDALVEGGVAERPTT